MSEFYDDDVKAVDWCTSYGVDWCSGVYNYHVLSMYGWLVVWNMAFIFPYIANKQIPTDELHHFSEG